MTILQLRGILGFTTPAAVQCTRGVLAKSPPCTLSVWSLSDILRFGPGPHLATRSRRSGLVQPPSVCAQTSPFRRSFSIFAKMDTDKTPASAQRCAIITGVARATGIGRTLVHQFLKHGYKVVGADVSLMEDGAIGGDKLPEASFHFVHGDISDPLQAKHIIEQAVQRFGGSINALINNAGRTNPTLGEDDRLKAFADTIAVNLNGAYYMSQFALPYMPAGKSSIIHMASTRALQSEPNSEGYAASKAGLCGLTHAQAITLSGKVRVNAVLPGWINTDPLGDAALRSEDHEWHPAGRVGVPDDVAHLCLFLCDNERAGFITGQEFVVDGGVTKKMIYPD